ncbi:Uncharacterized protein K02A2.6 [Eumeta japonica]|uniref:Uncharacterized protein K02A2.6 n=1 Tax=Eumeta variegata TaxID=151549 RepID=A0A4C1TF54_EUMVA|nr:Uncharacterized protein K02A2.6 [Eumeta japonica]
MLAGECIMAAGPRLIAFALKDKVIQEIDRLLELGILKPVNYSDFASPIVPVLKNNGSIRLCADCSVSFNKVLMIEKYPLPTVQGLFSKLHGGEQFTKLDLSMAYNQFELEEDCQNFYNVGLSTGAPTDGPGAVLTQVGSDDRERPVSYKFSAGLQL